LKGFYPNHDEFFCDTLGLSNANLKTFIDEAQQIQASDSHKYISQIFVAMNDYLKMNDDSAMASPSMAYPSMPGPSMAYPTMPGPPMAYPTIGYPTIPSPTMPDPSMAYPTMPGPPMAYPTMGYPTMPSPPMPSSPMPSSPMPSPRMPSPTENGMSQMLTKSRIFPVGTKSLSVSFDHLKTALESDLWFIADRWHLRQSFEGLVPLLSVDVELVDKISVLIQRTGLEYRLLSKVTSSVPTTKGPIVADLQYTKVLQAKARFIVR